jgi:hypothetical protein
VLLVDGIVIFNERHSFQVIEVLDHKVLNITAFIIVLLLFKTEQSQDPEGFAYETKWMGATDGGGGVWYSMWTN